jgi:hypothetical protein
VASRDITRRDGAERFRRCVQAWSESLSSRQIAHLCSAVARSRLLRREYQRHLTQEPCLAGHRARSSTTIAGTKHDHPTEGPPVSAARAAQPNKTVSTTKYAYASFSGPFLRSRRWYTAPNITSDMSARFRSSGS